MTKTLEIRFRKMTRRELRNGLLSSTIFAIGFMMAGLLTPLGNRYPEATLKFYTNHPDVYFLAAAIALSIYLYFFGSMIFGSIPRSFASNPAATLDAEKISSWTARGRQTILWRDVTSLRVYRPAQIFFNHN